MPNLPFTPERAATPIEALGKLTVPAATVKPFEAVNVDEEVIVFDDKAPEFVIDPDDKAAVHVIEFDVKIVMY